MSDPRNYDVIAEEGIKPIKMWTRGVPVEPAAVEQLKNIASLPFILDHVAVMPDVHLGKGATVGSVIATVGAIIPAAVGVDIGCGVVYQRTSLKASDLPDNLFALRTEIERRIPHGRTDNGGLNDRGQWHDVPQEVAGAFSSMAPGLKLLVDKHPKIERAASGAIRATGTLGGGNHFQEIVIDQDDQVGIMIHSGSRGIGNRIGQHFIELAKEDMRKWFINLPDADLSYLVEGTDHFNDYFEAVGWAQAYAKLNRDVMMSSSIEALRSIVKAPFVLEDTAVNCHHNYISRERHFGKNAIVTRKGAVSAQDGEMGIIPMSMGAKSFIVRGKGNRDSFCSCSHGAGRVMSRTEARKRFTLADHIADTAGVECRKDEEVIDETPKAYKDPDAVMLAQRDLVDIVHVVKQVLCIKG